MKKTIIDLYFRKCRIKKEKINASYQTAAYKVGISKNSRDRDTKGEFSRLINSDPDKHKNEVEIIDSLEIKGPEDFIKSIEEFIVFQFFGEDERYFGSKREYFNALEDSCKKYEQLIKTIELKQDLIKQLNQVYSQILETGQDEIIKYVDSEFSKLKNDIKHILSKSVLKSIDNSEKTNIITNINTNTNADITIDINNNIEQKSVSDVLDKDFILLISKKHDKLMLMHKVYHAGKPPLSIGGSFSASIGKEKFQWSKQRFANIYGYKEDQISTNKALKIFGQNIHNFDDPNFDKSVLP